MVLIAYEVGTYASTQAHAHTHTHTQSNFKKSGLRLHVPSLITYYGELVCVQKLPMTCPISAVGGGCKWLTTEFQTN